MSLVPSGYRQKILKQRQVPPLIQTDMMASQTLKLFQYQRLQRYTILLDVSRSSFEVSKYQDPLHILQEYVAEVSSMLRAIHHIFAAFIPPDLGMKYKAGIRL